MSGFGLSANDLAYLRTVQGLYLPDTCTILSVTENTSSTGAQTVTLGTVAASVACRMAALSYQEQQIALQINAPEALMLTVAYDQSLLTTHRVVYGGTTYEVLSVETAKSWQTVKRAMVKRLP